MIATLVASESIVDELQAVAREQLETAGVLIASVVQSDDSDVRLLARKIIWVDESAYSRREVDSLSIASAGYVHALRCAEELGATALWLHTHPGIDSLPVPSNHDEFVDQQIADLFRFRSGSPYYGTIILSPRPQGFTFTGYLQGLERQRISIRRFWTVGDRFRLIQSLDSSISGLVPDFDRNVRAFGIAVQDSLSDLQVGIVGCGGTGSVITEQLVRLGVRKITLVDPDLLSLSNVTRVYGSSRSDVGKPKVEVTAAHILRIAPEASVAPIQSMITTEQAAMRLTTCDVVFGCTDDNAGRLVLSRLATYLMTPVFDCGVLLTSSERGQLMGIDGRVTTMVPGQACLVCRGRIDIARASAELLTPDERVRRADEGYAPALGRMEPAVVTFTTAIGALAVSELLERLIGYGPEPRPSEILLRCHDREISTNVALPHEHHYCHPASGKIGRGITQPFLEQMWPT